MVGRATTCTTCYSTGRSVMQPCARIPRGCFSDEAASAQSESLPDAAIRSWTSARRGPKRSRKPELTGCSMEPADPGCAKSSADDKMKRQWTVHGASRVALSRQHKTACRGRVEACLAQI